MPLSLAKAILVGVFVFLAESAHADISLGDYQRKRESKEIQLYLSGVITGYEWANTDLTSRGATKLYCLRKDKVSSKNTVGTVLDRFIEKHKNLDPNWPIEMILMMSLKEQFPC